MRALHRKKIVGFLLAASIAVGPISTVRAGEGWGLLPWNPFATGKGSSAKSKPAPKVSAKKSPSTWTQLTRKTSSVLTDTKHTVMPWTKPDPSKRPPTRLTGSRIPAKPTTTRGGSKSDESWLSWLWGDDEKPQRPLTVSDWIIQPKPE